MQLMNTSSRSEVNLHRIRAPFSLMIQKYGYGIKCIVVAYKNNIKVVGSTRDLGANISTARVKHSSTLVDRIVDTAETLRRLNELPLTRRDKAKAIRTHAHPKALYGCEASSATEKANTVYGTNILDCITSGSGNRARDLSFQFCSRGNDLGPSVETFVRIIS